MKKGSCAEVLMVKLQCAMGLGFPTQCLLLAIGERRAWMGKI